MSFRDDYERKAHDIICLIKYGGYGGQATGNEIHKVADILRGRPIDPPRIPKLPVVKPVMPSIPTISIPRLP